MFLGVSAIRMKPPGLVCRHAFSRTANRVSSSGSMCSTRSNRTTSYGPSGSNSTISATTPDTASPSSRAAANIWAMPVADTSTPRTVCPFRAIKGHRALDRSPGQEPGIFSGSTRRRKQRVGGRADRKRRVPPDTAAHISGCFGPFDRRVLACPKGAKGPTLASATRCPDARVRTS